MFAIDTLIFQHSLEGGLLALSILILMGGGRTEECRVLVRTGRSLDISFWANSDIGATMYAYVHPSGFDGLV